MAFDECVQSVYAGINVIESVTKPIIYLLQIVVTSEYRLCIIAKI